MSPAEKCPNCDGRGRVPKGFYTPLSPVSHIETERCRSCRGKGIVWPDDPTEAAAPEGLADPLDLRSRPD